eukprot:gene1327-1344_t
MSEHHLPLVQSLRPRNFRERGVFAPFTTPMLTGARVRRTLRSFTINGERSFAGGSQAGALQAGVLGGGLRGSELEVIVPNPSGGRGVYIVPWADIGALCRPTMHDAMLGRSLSTPGEGPETDLTPARMRDAARAIALQGLAGRAAACAAEQSQQRHAAELVTTRFALLMEMTEQVEARGEKGPPLATQSPAEIERRGGLAMQLLASEIDQKPKRMSDLLDMLALHYVDLGIGRPDSGLFRLVERLNVLRHELTMWAQSDVTSALHDSGSASRCATAVAQAADLAARTARMALDATQARLKDMVAMLSAMHPDQAGIARFCERPAWLLDGWEQIWLTWSASPALLPRLEAVRLMSRQIPLLPDEAETWLGLPSGTAENLFRRPPLDQSPRPDTLSQIDLIARNEQLRAMAGAAIKDLQRTIAQAPDARIFEIVNLVDSLPERGAADALLTPLRARLQQIRPQRRLNFARLVFTPANPVIVPAAQWKRGSATLPRSALRALAQQIHRLLGAVSGDIEADIAGVNVCDHAAILRSGSLLWPQAADVLSTATPPDRWAEDTGLTATDHAAIALPLATLLNQGRTVAVLADRSIEGLPVPKADISACLQSARGFIGSRAVAGRPPIGLLLAALLARLPFPEDVLAVAGELAQANNDPAIRLASDLAIDTILASSATALTDQPDLALAAAELQRVLTLLDTLERPGPASRPARKQAIASLRKSLDGAGRQRFQADMARCLDAAIAPQPVGSPPRDTMRLEAGLRDLRRLEAIGRNFGGALVYDLTIAKAAARSQG